MGNGSLLRLILRKTCKAMEKVERASFSAAGLGISDFAVLEVLLNSGPLPVSAIGREVLLTSGSITTAVDRLTRKGLVVREQDETDGRIFHVHLTSRGKELIGKAFRAHTKSMDRLTEVLSTEERKELVRLLTELEGRAEAMMGETGS